MREVKFRVWNKEKKRMITKGVFKVLDAIENGKLDRDKFEILQYTGLKDINNREIYEGDIVEFSSGSRSVIFYKRGAVRFSEGFWIDDNSYTNVVDPDFVSMDDEEKEILKCKVIGNIYENPELLEVSKND